MIDRVIWRGDSTIEKLSASSFYVIHIHAPAWFNVIPLLVGLDLQAAFFIFQEIVVLMGL